MDRELLESRGIEPEYYDIWGVKHVTTGEAATAILKSLGDALDDQSTIVVRENADSIPVSIPADKSDPLLLHWVKVSRTMNVFVTSCRVVFETGICRDLSLSPCVCFFGWKCNLSSPIHCGKI